MAINVYTTNSTFTATGETIVYRIIMNAETAGDTAVVSIKGSRDIRVTESYREIGRLVLDSGDTIGIEVLDDAEVILSYKEVPSF